MFCYGQKVSVAGPFSRQQLPPSISGIDAAPDGSFYLVSDVDHYIYHYRIHTRKKKRQQFITGESLIHRYALPKSYVALYGKKSGLEAIRYVNDSIFIISNEYDTPDDRSASKIFLARVKNDSVSLTEMMSGEKLAIAFPDNTGFEGVAFSSTQQGVWFINERPFKEDEGTASHYVRLIFMDLQGNIKKQLAYPLQKKEAFAEEKAFKDNGVSDLLQYDDDHLLVMERAFAGTETCKMYVRIFKISLSDVEGEAGGLSMTKPQLLVDVGEEIPGEHVDNYEGLCFDAAAPLKDKLILISDDNRNWVHHTCPQTTDVLMISLPALLSH
jgi:hypothetical protein